MNAAERKIRVLIVDDDPEFTEMIAAVLEREVDRFETYIANSVSDGTDILSDASIDCVISDYRMPETDGLEFLESIREEYGDLPFILLTGQGDEGIASEAISTGVTDYVRKDRARGQYSLLATRITNAVEKRRTRRALGRRKRELESLNDRFQSFVRHSPDIITVLNRDGVIQYDSPAIEDVLGYDQDDRIGEAVIDYIHPDDRDRIEELFEDSSDDVDEARESFEYRFRHADESWLWIESIAIRRSEDSGSGYLMYSRDISERKARERQLEGKTERLEEFASIVSHDLQTPITVADARLEFAKKECDSEHLSAIDDALGRMEEIINATLTLAREGRVVDETEPIDLIEAAERWWTTVATDDATLETETEELLVSADRERLRRVLENLFANAVEHGVSDRSNSDDGPLVTVSVGALDDERGFYVADDGPGIPDGQHETIFEPGHSISPGGTGFGLAIVEEIVEAHGWEIEATESETGGARFEIRGVDPA